MGRSYLVKNPGRGIRGQVVDLVGQKFGFLVVVEYVGRRDKKGHLWKCRCDCGCDTVVVSHSLRRGATRSCGKCDLAKTTKPSLVNTWFGRCRATARNRSLEFTLTLAYFEATVVLPCYYCGGKPKPRKALQHSPRVADSKTAFNGLDRRDNDKGYVRGNVVPCCWVCNRAKSTMTVEEFNEWLDGLVKFRTGRGKRHK